MEQNLVSDEELLERINKVLHESKQDRKKVIGENRQDETSGEKFHDVFEPEEQDNSYWNSGEEKSFAAHKNLLVENHYLSLQLQAEKKKSKELQSKFKLFESSVKYFERLNGQLETIKKAVNEEYLDSEKREAGYCHSDTMQKIRPKTIHTAARGVVSTPNTEAGRTETSNFSEPHSEEAGINAKKLKEDKDEVAFRDAEDFKQLEQGLEIVRDKNTEGDSETEKVFITKTEKRCLEDIGNIAARTRAPLDDKHQRYFERDRRKFANSITMPEVQDLEKAEAVPPEIISKTKETPVNITSTELDGLRSYLLQLKELIARRETAWARTTERDYHQRVEITRFKNEVSHLRMLCEKRQKDIKEKDQIILSKDEEIRELQKRIQGLRNAIMKLEKKDERLMDTLDGVANEVLENSHLVQKSYNAMKRQSMINRSNATLSINLGNSYKSPANVTQVSPLSRGKEPPTPRKPKALSEKAVIKKIKGIEQEKASPTNTEEEKVVGERVKSRPLVKEKPKTRCKSDSTSRKKENYDKAEEKIHRLEEIIHNEGSKKLAQARMAKHQPDYKTLLKNHILDKGPNDFNPSSLKKLTPSNSTIRQEMLTAMTGLNPNMNFSYRLNNFTDAKKTTPSAAVIANALLAAKNANAFNY